MGPLCNTVFDGAVVPVDLSTKSRRKLRLEEFLRQNLDDAPAGNVIEWVERSSGVFRVLWTHQSSGAFTHEHAKLFRYWALARGKSPDQSPVELKQSLRMALNKSPSVKRVQTSHHNAQYRYFCFTNLKHKSRRRNMKLDLKPPNATILGNESSTVDKSYPNHQQSQQTELSMLQQTELTMLQQTELTMFPSSCYAPLLDRHECYWSNTIYGKTFQENLSSTYLNEGCNKMSNYSLQDSNQRKDNSHSHQFIYQDDVSSIREKSRNILTTNCSSHPIIYSIENQCFNKTTFQDNFHNCVQTWFHPKYKK